MSKAKFTKGEWKIIDKGNVYHVITSDTGFGICNTALKEEIDLANANLIAAAPEMYEMLEALREDYGLLSAVGKDIDKLLAKARGEHEAQ